MSMRLVGSVLKASSHAFISVDMVVLSIMDAICLWIPGVMGLARWGAAVVDGTQGGAMARAGAGRGEKVPGDRERDRGESNFSILA